MATNPLSTYTASASPPPPTSVALAAAIDFNGKTVPINNGYVTKVMNNLVFSLSNPVEIGSMADFFNFLDKSIGLPLSQQDVQNAIDLIPQSPNVLLDIRNALTTIFNAAISITILNINAASGSFMLGVTMDTDLPITSFLKINSIGVVVSKVGAVGSP